MATLRHKFALSFNDIMLVPQHSDVMSRLDTDLSTRLTREIKLQHPVCSTNMSTVTEFAMMKTMHKTGSAGFLHRFMPYNDIVGTIRSCKTAGIYPIVVSVGVKEEDYEIVDAIIEEKPDAILIDIAHGDHDSVLNMIRHIKTVFSPMQVIAGNIATKEAAIRYCHAGADAVRVGIGGSLVCATRTVTGHGVPTLQSIIDCKEGIDQCGFDVPIIADGGFKTSGDIAKALAFGAETVSLGTLLATTSDSPGKLMDEEEVLGWVGNNQLVSVTKKKKKFYGMASKEAQEIHRDGLKRGTAPEGVVKKLDYWGDTEDRVLELTGGIRSALTYSGARNLKEFRENAIYDILGAGGIKESKFAVD